MANDLERRRPGRPLSSDPSSPVSTRVPQSYHDRIVKLAAKHDVSVSAMVKTLLVLQLKRGA